MTTSAKDGDENEWADDDGATVTTGSPEFELPPDVPLPVSMPPQAGPAPAPVVPKAAAVPGSAPRVAAAVPAPRPAAGTPVRAPMAAPMPPRTGAMPPRAPMPGPMPARTGGAPASSRSPSQPKIPLPPPPARPQPPPAPAADEENEASTSVLDPALGAPLIAKMDELASEANDKESEADGDGPTMAVAAPGADVPPPARRGPAAKAVSPLARTAFVPDSEPEDESTRTVPRDELFREAHVVVGADAVGDEATLAVPPEALGRPGAPVPAAGVPANLASAFAATMAGGLDGPSPVFPPPPTGTAPFQALGAGPAAAGPMPAPPPARPPQQSWPDSGGYPVGPGSNPHQPVGPHPGAATHPGGYGMPVQPIPRPVMAPTQPGQNAPWPAPANTPRDPKAKMQLILLIVVGVVCVSIFLVGIYLFMSTMKEQPAPQAPARPGATAPLPKK